MQNKKIYIFLLCSFCFFVVTLRASGYVAKQPKADSILLRVNEARRVAELESLEINEQLNQAARAKAKDMASRGYFSHTSPQGLQPWSFVEKTDYIFTTAGENLAINFTESTDLVQAWLASDTHRSNILSPVFTETGIAIETVMAGSGTQTIIVQFFARPE